MRISHSKLEIARKNPSQFAKSVDQAFGGKSRYRYWQYATRSYHNQDDDRDAAVRHLIKLFEGFAHTSRSESILEDYIEHLDNYINDFLILSNEPVKVTDKIELDINFGNVLIGEIHRLDFSVAGGYEVYAFQKTDDDWESELRFPLIQHYYSREMGVAINEIKIGVYNFQLGKHLRKSFNQKDIDNAIAEVDVISEIISS